MTRTPYVEYTPPWYLRLQERLTADDQVKRKLISIIFSTRPLTLFLVMIALAAVAVFAFVVGIFGGVAIESAP